MTGNIQYTAYGRYRGGSEAGTENRFTGQKLDGSGLYDDMVRQAHQPTPAEAGFQPALLPSPVHSCRGRVVLVLHPSYRAAQQRLATHESEQD